MNDFRVAERGAAFLTYTQIVERIWAEIRKEENLAPIIIAGIRELRLFPEYRDATILLLDEINVTGESHFDQLLRQEMRNLENFLLDVSGD